MRRPGKNAFSIERLYGDIRARMPSDIHVHICTNRFLSKGFLTRLYDILRAFFNQGDVNHITGDAHFLTYLLKKKRTILTIHDCVTLERLHGIKRFIFWFLWYWLPEKRCKVITVVSQSTKEQVLRHVRCGETKVKVIYNNVSEEFTYQPKDFNPENPRILQIGTGTNKNLHKVAQALRGIECQLVIIGYLTEMQIAVLHKYDISYKNYAGISRHALLEQYFLCDMLVFASTYEGFGLPIIEANAVGRPVVTSNCWSMPEVAGDAACLVDPFNVSDIRNGILKVIGDSDYRENLIKTGFDNVKRFNTKNITNQYAELYRELYKNRNF